MARPAAPASAIKLAVVDIKIDGMVARAAENQIVVQAHIVADADAFKRIDSQLETLKAFRWQAYGALTFLCILLGAIEWLRIFFK